GDRRRRLASEASDLKVPSPHKAPVSQSGSQRAVHRAGGTSARAPAAQALPTLSVLQASAMMVGTVVGIGIFKTPPIAAANVPNEFAFLALWAAGGLLTLIGALCYAELG